jgi:hypothetical protein
MAAVIEMAVFVLVLGWAGWHAWTRLREMAWSSRLSA